MARQTTENQRRDFYQRHVKGAIYTEIGAAFGVSTECVRYWCRKQQHGQGVVSQWHIPLRGALSQFSPEVREILGQLRQRHPRWGPVNLQLALADELSLRGKQIPSSASIGRWLHQTPANRRQGRKAPAVPKTALRACHQRWEMDFKVNIRLANGQTLQLHDVYDRFSGAHIGAYLYPSQPRAKRVPLADVQTTLRRCFSEWLTLPEEVQTDGEAVLSGRADDPFPSPFTLWLTGLGITHRLTHPYRPTENGGVERCHRTINDYALEGQLHLDQAQLQAFLNHTRQHLNERYPSRATGCQGHPPLSAHPELLHPHQAYRSEWEQLTFSLQRVDAYLATLCFERKVNKTGQISLGGQHEYYSVGRAFARQTVRVTFDPSTREYIASLPNELAEWKEVQRFPARGLAVENFLWPDSPVRPTSPQQLALPLVLEPG